MHTLTTLIICSLSLSIVRIAMMPSPAAAAMADSLELTDYNNKSHKKVKVNVSFQLKKTTLLTNIS